jgi:hypothetical protein
MQWAVVDAILFIKRNEDMDRKVHCFVTPKSLRGSPPSHATHVACPHRSGPQHPLEPKSWPISPMPKFVYGYAPKC